MHLCIATKRESSNARPKAFLAIIMVFHLLAFHVSKDKLFTSGTYIAFEVALDMCAQFHVGDQPLQQLIADHPKEKHNDELKEQEQQDEEEIEEQGEGEDGGEDYDNDADRSYLLGLFGTYDILPGWDGGVDDGEVENDLAEIDPNETTMATVRSMSRNTRFTEPSYSRGSFLGPPWTSFADILK